MCAVGGLSAQHSSPQRPQTPAFKVCGNSCTAGAGARLNCRMPYLLLQLGSPGLGKVGYLREAVSPLQDPVSQLLGTICGLPCCRHKGLQLLQAPAQHHLAWRGGKCVSTPRAVSTCWLRGAGYGCGKPQESAKVSTTTRKRTHHSHICGIHEIF